MSAILLFGAGFDLCQTKFDGVESVECPCRQRFVGDSAAQSSFDLFSQHFARNNGHRGVRSNLLSSVFGRSAFPHSACNRQPMIA
jgi:hypothetical protein